MSTIPIYQFILLHSVYYVTVASTQLEEREIIIIIAISVFFIVVALFITIFAIRYYHYYIIINSVVKILTFKTKSRTQDVHPKAGSMLGQRRRRWPSIEPAFG